MLDSGVFPRSQTPHGKIKLDLLTSSGDLEPEGEYFGECRLKIREHKRYRNEIYFNYYICYQFCFFISSKRSG
ncbi:hypothetical protein BD293_1026 [Roseinatronobacter monicus]|uniref:Uncharacterized protein n=1 Tax=Roseinatronobacter monicus TaxID=393481 RepID=A0A543KBH7_9RHOB|nr:hypothetical protein BD293_1026 [Roseinatronobacter monicus]